MSDTITITGNIATDPEHRRTSTGVLVTSFRVASPQRRYDRATGTWVEAGTNFYAVSAFRNLAEHAFHSLRRGERVIVTGRLRVREWVSGDKRGTAVEIDADALGHDLLWGTSVFTKGAPVRTADAWIPDAADDVSAPEAAPASWTAPGVGAGDLADDSASPRRAVEPDDRAAASDGVVRELELEGTPF